MSVRSQARERAARRPRLRRVLDRALGVLLFASLTALSLELALRAVPAAIPTTLLKRFERGIRGEIARRRHLPNESQTRPLPRDDGGIPIRLFRPFSRIPFVYEDTGESGVMVMDGLGFCNAPADDYRRETISLIAVGDSFTVCHPPAPELAWPSVLGRRLDVAAYNLGRGGYGPYEYVQILRAIGLAKRPSIVVLLIYEGNDLRDAVRHHEYREATPDEREQFPERASLATYSVDPSGLLRSPLGRWSYAYNLAVVALARAASRADEAWRGAARVDFRYRLRFPNATVAMNVRNTDRDEVRTARAVAAGTVSFSALDGALARFAELARAHDFRALIAYAPSAHSAYAEFVEFEDPSLAPLLPAFSRRQRDHVRRQALALGVEYLDLTPALRAAARREREARLLYFPINVHFTPAGHEVAAEALAEYLARPRRSARAPAQTEGTRTSTIRAPGWWIAR